MPDCLGFEKRVCLNDARPGRTLCRGCERRKYRKLNRMREAYNTLRDHARARHVKFALTLDYWKLFCKRTNYLALAGHGKEDMTVDRVIPALGYIDGNIQMITRSANAKKRFQDAKEKYKHQPAERDPDVPF